MPDKIPLTKVIQNVLGYVPDINRLVAGSALVKAAKNPEDSFTPDNLSKEFSEKIKLLTLYGIHTGDPTKDKDYVYVDDKKKKDLLKDLKYLPTKDLTLNKESLSDLIKLLKHSDKDLSSFAGDTLSSRDTSFDEGSVSILTDALNETQPEEKKEEGKYTKGERIRITLLEAIGNTKDKEAISILLEIGLNGEEYEFMHACDAIKKMESSRVGPVLISIIKRKKIEDTSENDFVKRRARAIETLGRIKYRKAVPDLIKALSDGEWKIRDNAAYALGEIGDKKAVPALIKALVGGDKIEGNLHAAYALGKIKDADSVPELIKIYENGDTKLGVKERALKVLIMIGDERVVPLLEKSIEKGNCKWIIDYDVIKNLKGIDSKILLPLLVKIVESNFDNFVNKKNDGLSPYDIEQLKRTKRDALDKIIKSQDKDTLIKLLKETKFDGDEERQIIWALAKLNDKKLVPALIEIYNKENKSNLVKMTILDVLCSFKDEKEVVTLFFKALSKSAADRNGEYDYTISRIISILAKEAGNAELLKKIMKDSKNDFVKESIANHLVELNDIDAMEYLLMKSKNEFSIKAAADALLKMYNIQKMQKIETSKVRNILAEAIARSIISNDYCVE